MLAVIHDPDPHGRAAARGLLSELGYRTVLEADTREKAQFYLEREGASVSLVLGVWETSQAPEFALGQWMASRAELALTPLILLASRSLAWIRLSQGRPHSRVDSLLEKPFGAVALRGALFVAQRRRAESRKVLGYVGGREAPRLLLESTFATVESGDWGWAEVRRIDDPSRLTDVQHAEIGALLVEVAPENHAQLKQLVRFRKTRLGCQTPVIALSRDPGTIRGVRTLCDLFLERPESAQEWRHVLNVAGYRLRFHFQAKWMHGACRQALKSGRKRLAMRLARQALQIDPTRCESLAVLGCALEARGHVDRAVTAFQAAVAANPCYPAPYLRLFELCAPKERASLARLVGNYCPEHPQLRAFLAETQEGARP